MVQRYPDERRSALSVGQRRRIEEHLYVVRWVIGAMRRELTDREHRGGDPDDPPAWGNWGLVQAAQTYDAEMEGEATALAAFESYSWWRVRGSIRDELRRERRIALREELTFGEEAANDYTASQVDGGDLSVDSSTDDVRAQVAEKMAGCAAAFFGGVAASAHRLDPERALLYARAWAVFEKAFARLPDRDRSLVGRRWFEGQTWAQIVAGTGLKKATAERYYASAMKRLAAMVLAQAEPVG